VATERDTPGTTRQAVYRSQTHDVLVVQPERERATLNANFMLVHELVHAVQAQQGLFARKGASFDQRLVWRARLEGEAVVRSHRFKAQLEGLDPRAIDWESVFGHWSQRSLLSIKRASSPLAVAVATLPYARGAWWYWWSEDQATAAWPERFGELLGEPAQESSRGLGPAAHPACSGEAEELGALSLLAFVLPVATESEASDAAQGLGSDQLCVHSDGRFSWQLVWPGDARAAAALVQQRAAKLGLGVRLQTASDALRVTIAGGA
jgi:hypothetical protein